MAYPRMRDWEHCIRDTSRTKKRVFGKSRNDWEADTKWSIGWIGYCPCQTWALSWRGRNVLMISSGDGVFSSRQSAHRSFGRKPVLTDSSSVVNSNTS